MQIRCSKSSCMGKENRLYSISLGVASLQGGLVGVATALSPATCRPFQVFSPSFFVGLELEPCHQDTKEILCRKLTYPPALASITKLTGKEIPWFSFRRPVSPPKRGSLRKCLWQGLRS